MQRDWLGIEGGLALILAGFETRSGKIMRRILRKVAENEFGNLGDTSTLADPGAGRTI